MIEHEILDLEKIKDLISFFNDLQSANNLLHSLSDDFDANDLRFEHSNISKEDLNAFRVISNSIQSLIVDLILITDHNINIFNEFQNKLLSKFIRTYVEKLKRLGLHKNTLQQFGNSLIKNRNVSKIISNISYIHSIRLTQWLELIDSLKQNSTFHIIIKKVNSYHQNLIENKLNEQLRTIQGNFDKSTIDNFKKAFYENPNLTFSDFKHIYETSLSKEELNEKKNIIQREREKLELEKLKENQEKQDELYQDYLRLPSKEFERKMRKERRGKLTKIDLKSNHNMKIEISKEASEKIEKFKSSLDKSLKDDYLLQKNEDKSPIELIRERKKKKTEEFKKYKKHFDTK